MLDPLSAVKPQAPRFSGDPSVKVPFGKKLRYALVGSLIAAGGAGVINSTEKAPPWQVSVMENRLTGNRHVVRNDDGMVFETPFLHSTHPYSREPRTSSVPLQLSIKGVDLPKVPLKVTWAVDGQDVEAIKRLDIKVAQGLANEKQPEGVLSPMSRYTQGAERYVLIPAMQKATEDYFANLGRNLGGQVIDAFRGKNSNAMEQYYKEALLKEGIRIDKIDMGF